MARATTSSRRKPGTSYLTVRDRLTDANRQEVARFVADIARRLHAIKPVDGALQSSARRDWTAFLLRQAGTCVERHRAWGALPDGLIEQIDDGLSTIEAMVIPADRWSLLHGDLTADHILGEWRDDWWTPTGVIDFGVARLGDRMYELVSLHIECSGSDKGMLWAFLDHYGREAWPSGCDFARRAMSMTLLHEFNVLKTVFERYPEARDAPSLEALAAYLWDAA
ncbi:MAG: aminoglycoside phosphotransferase family protein [Thermomicrobiales bacterium]